MNDECMRTEYKCFPGGKILHPSSYDKCKSEYLQLFIRIESPVSSVNSMVKVLFLVACYATPHPALSVGQ